MRASDITRIVDTYISKKEEPKFSRLVTKEEIRANGYNLNIPRYVNSSDDAETLSLIHILPLPQSISISRASGLIRLPNHLNGVEPW